MSFQPSVLSSGLAGWHFLSRTREAQEESFVKSAQIQRDAAYFTGKIDSILTAEQLVSDRRLLSVALGAFGLEADIGAKAFVQKVLEGGTLDERSLANRLSDKRYLQLAEAFGFGEPGDPNTKLSEFPSKILSAYYERQFETAVGKQQSDLRLAMGFTRDLDFAIQRQNTENGRWFAVMGNPPLRQVVQTALGLPKAFAGLDIDRQLVEFKAAALRVFGTDKVSDLSKPEMADQVIRRFLVRSEVAASAATLPGQMALMLLQSARR